MPNKGARIVWIVPVFLALAVLACSGGTTEPTATPLPRPTQRPLASATTASTQVPATRVPRSTATRAADQPTDVPTEASTVPAPFQLSSKPYTHKSGAFTVTLPDGWKVTENSDSIYTISPDKVASIYFSFTNVGAKFDAATMATYIKAEEDNWFATFKDYQAKPNETLKDGSILVHKTLSLSDGTPEVVFSYYWQDGNVIYEQDFWVDSSSYDQYVDALVQVADTTQTDATAGGKSDAYAEIYKFTDPTNDLYEFDVPYGFIHETSPYTNTDIETFTSPDKLSYVENIEYDDGTQVSKSDAGAFALDLLKQYYQLTDIKITDDKPQSDGSELLVWNSAAQGIDGESYFETRGTTFLLLTWVADTNQVDFFRPVWSTLVKSYQVPQP